MKNLFVGNLPPKTTENELKALFETYGTVRKLEMPRDIFTGRNKGFALIAMEGHEARTAISNLNGKDYMGNTLKIRDEKSKKHMRGGRR